MLIAHCTVEAPLRGFVAAGFKMDIAELLVRPLAGDRRRVQCHASREQCGDHERGLAHDFPQKRTSRTN